MKPDADIKSIVSFSPKDIETLRSIAATNGDYTAIKKLLGETDWTIEEDEVELGYLRIIVPTKSDACYRLIIAYQDPDHPPYCLLTLALFPDSEEHLPAFNAVFDSASHSLTQYFGQPAVSGTRQLPFRTWSYSHKRWSLAEGEFTLVQDEFDIQEGMDVTLWIQPNDLAQPSAKLYTLH